MQGCEPVTLNHQGTKLQFSSKLKTTPFLEVGELINQQEEGGGNIEQRNIESETKDI